MDQTYAALIHDAVHRLTRATGGSPFSPSLPEFAAVDSAWQSSYQAVLGQPADPGEPLISLFARLSLGEAVCGERQYYAASPLEPRSAVIFPQTSTQAAQQSNPAALWNGFQMDYQALVGKIGFQHPAFFEAFYHLMRKYAWSLPGFAQEPGLSLFEYWKALVALVSATGPDWQRGPADEFSLVGGDFPGIQDFVYTITSKGAAKGLRGRSFFLQILGDAIVRHILTRFHLPSANLIYAAGGNFMLLAPAASQVWDGSRVADCLSAIRESLEASLLAELDGDLALCLAWRPVFRQELGDNNFSQRASRALKEDIARQKNQRFATIFASHWESLIKPQGFPGSRYCAVCQSPLQVGEGIPLEDDSGQGESRRCASCVGFQELAEDIGQPDRFLSISTDRPAAGGKHWQNSLWAISQLWYSFKRNSSSPPGGREQIYSINDSDFILRNCHGFKWIANTTPKVTELDGQIWDSRTDDQQEPRPRKGTIRTFSQMADVAQGVQQVGVLRMDVDDLGRIMVRGLEPRTMAATSALSAAMELFFSAYLNQICADMHQTTPGATFERGDCLYTIYAGGDDLFICGAWDLLPDLAYAIHRSFQDYTCHNSDLHISGGITLEDRKFPLYQAAENAGVAEEHAKQFQQNGRKKDAVTFLGQSLGWGDWLIVQDFQRKMTASLRAELAPKALLHNLLDIYAQHEQQVADYPPPYPGNPRQIADDSGRQIHYGPWMWRCVYALARLAERVKDQETKMLIHQLSSACVDQYQIRFAGLAARWAELLTRKET